MEAAALHQLGDRRYGCYIFDMDETLAKYNCVEVYKVRVRMSTKNHIDDRRDHLTWHVCV